MHDTFLTRKTFNAGSPRFAGREGKETEIEFAKRIGSLFEQATRLQERYLDPEGYTILERRLIENSSGKDRASIVRSAKKDRQACGWKQLT